MFDILMSLQPTLTSTLCALIYEPANRGRAKIYLYQGEC